MNAILQETDEAVLLDLILERVPRLVNAGMCSIFMLHGNELWLERTTSQLPSTRRRLGSPVYDLGQGLTGWVAKANRSLRVSRVDDQADVRRAGQEALAREGAAELSLPSWSGGHCHDHEQDQQFLGVPIAVGHEVLGVIRVSRGDNGNLFGAEEEQLLRVVARHIGTALRNAQQRDSLQILNLLEPVLATVEADSLLTQIVNSVPSLVRAQVCSVFLIQRGALHLERTTSPLSETQDKLQSAVYALGQGLTGWVAAHGISLRIADVRDPEQVQAAGCSAIRAANADLPLPQWSGGKCHDDLQDRQFLGVPIKAGDETLGVLRVSIHQSRAANPHSGETFTRTHQDLLEAIARHLGTAIKTASLRKGRKDAEAAVLSAMCRIIDAVADGSVEARQNTPRVLQEILSTTHELVGLVPTTCFALIRTQDPNHSNLLVKQSVAGECAEHIPEIVDIRNSHGSVAVRAFLDQEIHLFRVRTAGAAPSGVAEIACEARARRIERLRHTGHDEYADYLAAVKSAVGVPLIVPSGEGPKTLGVLVVASTEPDAFDEQQDVPTLKAFAKLATIALVIARYCTAVAETERRSWQQMSRIVRHQVFNRLTALEALRGHLTEAVIGSDLPNAAKRELRDKIAKETTGTQFDLRQIINRLGPGLLDKPRLESVDLTSCINRLVREFSMSTPQVQFVRDLDDSLPLVVADVDRVTADLSELLGNAIKSIMGSGSTGKITIRGRYLAKWQTTVAGSRLTCPAVRIDVLDTGPGIRSDLVERVFEPEFSTDTRGTGLGLFFVKHDIELQGGAVAALPGPGGHLALVIPVAHTAKETDHVGSESPIDRR